MTVSPFEQLACPLDGEPLLRNDASWCCANGHSFDIAAKGYTHLLPVQHKRSLDPGDHKTMVAARQRFLNSGFYQSTADAVGQLIITHVGTKPCINVLDAGCGEGYYLREIAATYSQQHFAFLGVDISKWAVLAAAKQDSRINWIVASNAHLPVQANSVDCILCLFGFPTYTEFQRVLKPCGFVIQVDSGPEHLRALREVIYPEQKPDKVKASPIAEGFTLIAEESLRYDIQLRSSQAIADLLAMTPHYYRITSEGHAKAAALTRLDVAVDIRISIFQASE